MAFAFAGQYGPEPVIDRYGNAIYSATFRVLTTAGAEATVYTDRTKATTVSQPLDVDGEANATFYAAPGRYTVELTAGGSVTSFPVGVVPDAEDVEPAPDVDTRFAATEWRTGRLVHDVTDAAYGAVGDGSTDDRAAIMAAVAATQPHGGTVFLPWGASGVYNVSDSVVVAATDNYVTIESVPGVRLHSTSPTAPGLVLGDATGATSGARRATVRNLRVTCAATADATTAQHGVVVGKVHDGFRLLDVRIGDPGLGAGSAGAGDGLRLVDAISGRVERCTVDFAGQDGISVHVPDSGGGANATVIRETTSRQNGRHGFLLATPGAGASATYHLRVLGGVYEANGQRGMLFAGSPINAEVDGPQIESNGAASQINGGLVTLRNMAFLTYGWDVAANGVYTFERCLLQDASPLSIASAVKGVTLRDCVLESAASLADLGEGTIVEGARILGGNGHFPQPPTFWIGADDFEATGSGGAPVLGRAGSRFNSWLLDPDTAEQIQTTFAVPQGWVAAHFDLYWANAGTGTGDVRWTGFTSMASDGTDLTTGDTAFTSQAVTAAAQNVLKVTRLATSRSVTGGGVAHMRIMRDAANAADTLPNDCHLIGVRLTRSL